MRLGFVKMYPLLNVEFLKSNPYEHSDWSHWGSWGSRLRRTWCAGCRHRTNTSVSRKSFTKRKWNFHGQCTVKECGNWSEGDVIHFGSTVSSRCIPDKVTFRSKDIPYTFAINMASEKTEISIVAKIFQKPLCYGPEIEIVLPWADFIPHMCSKRVGGCNGRSKTGNVFSRTRLMLDEQRKIRTSTNRFQSRFERKLKQIWARVKPLTATKGARALWQGGESRGWWKVNPKIHNLNAAFIFSSRKCKRIGMFCGGDSVPRKAKINFNSAFARLR